MLAKVESATAIQKGRVSVHVISLLSFLGKFSRIEGSITVLTASEQFTRAPCEAAITLECL